MVTGKLTKVTEDTSAIHLLIDGSGSMQGRWPSTLGSINEFVAARKEDQPNATIIVTVFGGAGKYSTSYNGPVADCPTFTNGNMPNLKSMTALLDSTVRALNDLNATGATRRQLVSITDGGENDSKEYRGKPSVVREMLDEARANGTDVVALAVGEEAWGNDSVYGLNNTIRATASAASYSGGMAALNTRSMAYLSSSDTKNFASNVKTVGFISDDGTALDK